LLADAKSCAAGRQPDKRNERSARARVSCTCEIHRGSVWKHNHDSPFAPRTANPHALALGCVTCYFDPFLEAEAMEVLPLDLDAEDSAGLCAAAAGPRPAICPRTCARRMKAAKKKAVGRVPSAVEVIARLKPLLSVRHC